jgi:hypothetical protein
MRVGIMQPYFLPYVGYFQLISAVDAFIIYDNIKYTKKGWINRNRMLCNGSDAIFSLPLRGASDSLNVSQRELASDFDPKKLLQQFKGAYATAPQFDKTYPVLERIMQYGDANLFKFVHHSVVRMCEHLGIQTEIRISSRIDIDHGLRGQEKVLALCKATGANTYINPIGGVELYSRNDFRTHGIDLKFVKTRPFEYAQFGSEFVPWLSIVDALMFNPMSAVSACIHDKYDLI